MDGKILSMDGEISSMDKSVISGKKMMDDLFIRGCHPWIKTIDDAHGRSLLVTYLQTGSSRE